MQERIFTPLGLADTGFFIDKSKTGRVSKLHSTSNDSLASTMANTATSKPRRLSPSGGLLSTAEDYWRFCQMLLNKGEFKGKRLLKEETVKLMHTNLLEKDVSVKLGGATGGVGFGVDFAVVMDQAASRNSMPKESFYWGGAYGTWFWIDPVNDIAFVGMIQNAGAQSSGDSSLREISAKAAYAALREK
jgi:CubicO group peptidase (beta-lactamase class C family)